MPPLGWSCEGFGVMPNRGPIDVSLADVRSLLAELPSPRDNKEAEDDEDRQRIKLHVSLRSRVEEQVAALSVEGAAGTGVLIFSIDEVDEILDVLPPPPLLTDVRERLQKLKLSLMS